MPGLALDAIRRSYGRARLRRQPWEPLWRECYAYALPQRGYGLGAEFGQARRYNETLFDGTAPDAVDQLSSSGDERTRWGSALAVEGLDGLVDGDVEGVGVTERAVGEVVALQVAPGPLDVVQLGRVPRQPLDREPGPRRQRLPARLARVDRAVVEHQDHRPADPSRRRAVDPVEPPQQGDEVARALGPAGEDDQLAPGVVEHAEERALPRPPRPFHPQVGAARRPAVGQVGVGQCLGLVPEQEVDVTRRRLPLQEPEPQAGAVDGVRVLPALEGVSRPAPAVAPFRGTTLR